MCTALLPGRARRPWRWDVQQPRCSERRVCTSVQPGLWEHRGVQPGLGAGGTPVSIPRWAPALGTGCSCAAHLPDPRDMIIASPPPPLAQHPAETSGALSDLGKHSPSARTSESQRGSACCPRPALRRPGCTDSTCLCRLRGVKTLLRVSGRPGALRTPTFPGKRDT